LYISDVSPDLSVSDSAWGKHFSDERGPPFNYLKIGFLKYLRISGEIRYPNGPIGYRKKQTIWKEASIVHVGAIIHEYQGTGAL